MSRTVSVRPDRMPVTELPVGARETAERMYDSLKNDFMRMKSFRRHNPRAQLAGADRAWVCPGENTFFVEILNVQNIDASLAATEAHDFTGTVSCVGGTWILSVPLRAVAPLGFSVTTWLAVVVLVVAALGVMWPGPTWRVAVMLYVNVMNALAPLLARAQQALFS